MHLQEQEEKLTINTIEKLLGIMIAALIQMGLGMAGDTGTGSLSLQPNCDIV